MVWMGRTEEIIVRELLFKTLKSISKICIEGTEYIRYSDVVDAVHQLTPELVSALHNRNLL